MISTEPRASSRFKPQSQSGNWPLWIFVQFGICYHMRIIFLLALTFFVMNTSAQDQNAAVHSTQAPVVRFRSPLADSAKRPLLVIDGKPYMMKQLNAVNHTLIQDVSIINRNIAIAKYGNHAQYGALVIVLKKGTRWIRVSDVLKKNHIKEEEKVLPIVYQGNVLKLDSLTIGKRMQYRVEIENTVTSPLKDRTVKGRYLSITETKAPELL